jgi:hypothetical protein
MHVGYRERRSRNTGLYADVNHGFVCVAPQELRAATARRCPTRSTGLCDFANIRFPAGMSRSAHPSNVRRAAPDFTWTVSAHHGHIDISKARFRRDAPAVKMRKTSVQGAFIEKL